MGVEVRDFAPRAILAHQAQSREARGAGFAGQQGNVPGAAAGQLAHGAGGERVGECDQAIVQRLQEAPGRASHRRVQRATGLAPAGSPGNNIAWLANLFRIIASLCTISFH